MVCNDDVGDQLDAMFHEGVKIIRLKLPTRGAADTLLQASAYLPKGHQIACIDCDTIFHETAIKKAVSKKGNFLLTFNDLDKTGLYSYVKLQDEVVVEIREKIAISSTANAGFYAFCDVETLRACCSATLQLGTELYLSKAVERGIEQGCVFTTVDVSGEFDCCGTPYQLKTYAKTQMADRKYRISFDIDGTLVYDLLNAPYAIEKNVKFCNEAYRNGHLIILHTARGMMSKNGDKDLIEASRPYIEQVLKDLGILYHELVLMKPYADIYIDDKAIAAHRDLPKETGLYLFEDHAARHHNTIIVRGDRVVKSGNLKGECYYYKHIPLEVKDLFPAVYLCKEDIIEIQRIPQSTYSSLLLSRRLTKSDMDILLNSLDRLHKVPLRRESQLDVLWAYKDKVISRFDEHRTLYDELGVDVAYYTKLIDQVTQVELGIIHGDAVLTNVFSDGEQCKFIDMRGVWDGQSTLCGDTHYDYAKVLQSLWGYDYALHNEPIQESYLTTLRDHYLAQLQQRCPELDLHQLQIKVQLLYVSLLPLHREDVSRCKRFIEILANLKIKLYS